MKSTFTLLLLLLMWFNGFSQGRYEFGLKGAIGMTGLMNKSVVTTKYGSTFALKLSTGIGGHVGYNFDHIHCLAAELMYATERSSYTAPAIIFQRDIVTTVWNSFDYSLLYRIRYKEIYGEVGPRLSSVTHVRQRLYEYAYEDKTDQFTKNMFGAMVGLGMQLNAGQHFNIAFGGRVEYTFSNFVSDSGKRAFQPWPTENRVIQDKTNILNLVAHLEVNYLFGTPSERDSK